MIPFSQQNSAEFNTIDNTNNSDKHKLPLDLVIFGQATIDDIYREDEGLISPRTPGGDSIYALLGATVWPVRAGIVCCVGHDYPHDRLTDSTCNYENTDWSGFAIYDNPSIHLKATYFNDGRRKYVFDDDNLLHFLSPGIQDIPHHMRNCPHVHIAPADCVKQFEILQFYKDQGALVTLDIESHFFVDEPQLVYEMLKCNPIFVPSIEHIQQLSGSKSKDPLELWQWIKTCGVDFAVVKCGADGSWVFDVKAKKLWVVGVVPDLDIVDATGAGDSYCGGFLAGMKITNNPIISAAYGAVSASFIVESMGAKRPVHYTPELAASRFASLKATLPSRPVSLP